MSKNILTNLQLYPISQYSINEHMDNGAYFLKSTPPRALGVLF